MKSQAKNLALTLLPLAVRRPLAVFLNRMPWIDSSSRNWWTRQLLTDLAGRDRNAYHKFLWQNHLAYAETYEVNQRFGYENFNETRRMFFAELPQRISDAGLGSAKEFKSVLEVGCSLGYLLRYMETDIFTRATDLVGLDIDAHAIESGRKELDRLGSTVRLVEGDMENFQAATSGRQFDFVFGSGILLYLEKDAAQALVARLLAATNKMLAITALAHPEVDNARLQHSVPRQRDRTWIHNVDQMIRNAGGTVVGRRWEATPIDGNTVYFLYATPGGQHH